ncbi:MAG: PD-(D/E)XK nuclease family protein [Clostridia bacterium]|nr:PD-(D/E)XK nuclease family protein [Clostridia bacterium]
MNIILGKSKTGKSTHIFRSIEDDIKEDREVILFVPSQSRAKTENEYMRYLKKDGIIGVNITTISEYISENLKSDNLHFDDNYISKLDRKILLSQVINENEEMFNIFRKVRMYPGFLDMLNIYMDILRKECIDISEFKKIKIEDKLLDYKLKEIIVIYEKYIEKLGEKYIDNIDEMDIFLEKILPNKFSNSTKIYFDGYNNFTINEYRFIKALVRKNVDITFSLVTDITRKEDIGTISNHIFDVSNSTYSKLLKIANDEKSFVNNIIKYENYSEAKEDLKYLADKIFENSRESIDSENIHINIYTNHFKEVQQIAKRISYLVKNGYRYKDICIYTTNIDSYKKLIERIFYEYHIKLYVNTSKTIEESLLLKYILGLLDLMNFGMNTEEVFEILKLGLNDINEEEIYVLQNYILEFNISKYSLFKEFKVNNVGGNGTVYDLEEINSIRKKMIDIFKNIANIDKSTSVKNIIYVIYEHLEENNIFYNYEKFLNDEELHLELKNYELQIWDKICEIFDSIGKMYHDENINISEFTQIFKMAIKDTNVKMIPPTLDQVELADINVSKIGMKKIVFFIGVNENSFPKKIDQDIFFGDFELEKLEDVGIELKETSLSKLNMGLYNIYEALNNVSEKLYISIPASDFSGKATRMSSLIVLIRNIINVKIIGDVTNDEEVNLEISNIFSKEELFDKFIQRIKLISDFEMISDEEKANLIALYEYFISDKVYHDILNFRKEDRNLSEKTLERMYGNELKTSVSRLEQFKKCPFSYYMQYTLNIKPKKQEQINVMDIGSFMHAVLERFSIYLFNHHIAFHMILNEGETLEKKYEDILYKIIMEELEEVLYKQKESVKFSVLKQKLINTMKKVMIIIAKSFNQSEFVPFGCEMEFKENAVFSPIEIDISNHKKIVLNGKIDRIDILEKDNEIYARVVDYKSSDRKLDINDIKEGLSLQLISYLNVFMENEGKKSSKIVIPAGMLYFNLSDKLIGLTEYTDNNEEIEKKVVEALRMKGIFLKDVTILEKMDHKFSDSTKRLIDISARSLNGKSNKALEREEFEKLCKEAREILKNIGTEMMSGVVKISPNKKAEYCKFCNYSSVCRKDICL